jgi:hypothetical protein
MLGEVEASESGPNAKRREARHSYGFIIEREDQQYAARSLRADPQHFDNFSRHTP